MTDRREMKSEDVVWLLRQLGQADVPVWLDGGWGVDALLGEQTRHHGDLDIVVQLEDVPKLRQLLEAGGYRDVPRAD
jgi:lincosamide nucleotidyltransferase A/C/D/E